MNEIMIHQDSFSYRTMPDISECKKIRYRIIENIRRVNDENIKSFVNLVGNDGRAFCPVTINKDFYDNESLEQTQLFVLTFDNATSFEVIKERADQYELPILFAYAALDNSIDHSMFRVVFLNDISISDMRAANILKNALLTIFPEAIEEIHKMNTMYLGGRKLLYFDETIPEINIESTIRNMSFYLMNRYGVTNYKRKIGEFARENMISLNENKFLNISLDENILTDSNEDRKDEFNKISPFSIILNKSNGEKLLNLYYRIDLDDGSSNNLSSEKNFSEVHKSYRSTDFVDFKSSCRLLKEFINGIRTLKRDELRGLATNLIHVESGSSEFKKSLTQNPYYENQRNNWNFYLSYFNQSESKPMSCNHFCPYKNECNHGENLLSTSKLKRHTTIKLANCKKSPHHIDEVRDDFNRELMTAIDTTDTRIHAIKAPIGIGKSTRVLDLMELGNQRIMMAFPSNDLKNEKFEEAIKRGIKAVKSPSLLEIRGELPANIWSSIEQLYQTGRHHTVYDYINNIIARGETNKHSSGILQEYQNELIKFHTSKCHAFTTHSRLLTLDYFGLKGYDARIIDEDPILNCFIPNQIGIPILQLIKVLDQIDSNSELAKKIKMVAAATETRSWIILKEIKYENAYDAISTPIDIASFCKMQKFFFKKKSDEDNLLESNQSEDSIIFLKPLKLDPRLSYITLSATSNQRIYNICFGANRVQFYHCNEVKNKGTLNQYDRYTMSRSDINRNRDIIDNIKKHTGFEDTITFKKYGIGNEHFGKTTGVDSLRGKNLDVIGTPHQPEWVYKLFAYTLGHDIDKDARMRYQPISHNGFKSWFMTFDDNNKLLRDIQLWMIESELVQAVGRARLSLEDSTVNLFSNFPLSHANIKEYPDEIKKLYDKN